MNAYQIISLNGEPGAGAAGPVERNTRQRTNLVLPDLPADCQPGPQDIGWLCGTFTEQDDAGLVIWAYHLSRRVPLCGDVNQWVRECLQRKDSIDPFIKKNYEYNREKMALYLFILSHRLISPPTTNQSP